MELTLARRYGDMATTGVLTAGALSLFTIELPWRNNAPDASCVPEGVFQLVRYLSPTHGWTWCLRNPDLKIMGCDQLTADQVAAGFRSFSELHSANWARQLLGCIAAGLHGQPMLDPLTGKVEPAVENSVDAIAELHALLDPLPGSHTLTITAAT